MSEQLLDCCNRNSLMDQQGGTGMTVTMEYKRIEYIDIMKDFAIMLVVMGHVLLGCKSESMPGLLEYTRRSKQ